MSAATDRPGTTPEPTSDPGAAAFTAVAISGSIRAASSNTGLIRMAARVAPADLRVTVLDITDLPFYDADLEGAPPASVLRFRAAVAEADALIIGLPEYNFLPSPTALNAIAWVSRPYGKHLLQKKVCALLTSAGRGGGAKSQEALAPVLGLLGNVVVDEPVVRVALGEAQIDVDGSTSDPGIEALVRAKMDAVLATLRTRADANGGNVS